MDIAKWNFKNTLKNIFQTATVMEMFATSQQVYVKLVRRDFLETFVKRVIMNENILLKKNTLKKSIFQTANVMMERMEMFATSQRVYVELVRRDFLETFVIGVIIIKINQKSIEKIQ